MTIDSESKQKHESFSFTMVVVTGSSWFEVIITIWK